MVKQVLIRQTGNSVAATIPREMADRLHFGAGDTVFAMETEEGVLITPYDPTVAKAMQLYEESAKRNREALRRLAR